MTGIFPRRGRWRRFGALAAVFIGGVGMVLFFDRPAAPVVPRDRPLTRPIQPLHITAFGTSLTAKSDWPERLVAGVSQCLDQEVTLGRVARSGQGSAWALDQVDRVIAQAPGLVLVEFAINDADVFGGISLAASRQNHDRLLARLRDGLPEAQVMMMTTNPVTGPVRHLQRPRLARYYAMVRDVAEHRDVALADLAPRWRAAFAADPDVRPPDGLHPSDRAAAQVIVPVLIQSLGAGACEAKIRQ